MQAGLVDRLWSMEDLYDAVMAAQGSTKAERPRR